MTSNALTKWQIDRAVRLDRLEVTHASVPARALADSLNRALVLQLTAEFQGFARDLHDETARSLVTALAPGDPPGQDMLIVPYTTGRRLNRGNADPTTLNQDFGLFGCACGTTCEAPTPSRRGSGMTGSRF